MMCVCSLSLPALIESLAKAGFCCGEPVISAWIETSRSVLDNAATESSVALPRLARDLTPVVHPDEARVTG